MYILDTDHLSILDRGGAGAYPLLTRLANIDPGEVMTTIISYEEQMRGWLSYLNKVQPVEAQVIAYTKLKQQLLGYCKIPVLEFNEQAAQIFKSLRGKYPRLGTMDLKIASISLTNQAVLLTRNISDFATITELSIEDWT